MKFIRKDSLNPEYLSRSHTPRSSQEAKLAWKKFGASREPKLTLRNKINIEQSSLCGYTELNPQQHGLKTHLEHIKPKSKYPSLTFSYHNLLLSSLTGPDIEKLKNQSRINNITWESFAGDYKGNEYNTNLFLSPLWTSSKYNYYTYLSDGRVIPSKKKSLRYQKKCRYMISLLNLNAPYLVNIRKTLINDLDSEIIDPADFEFMEYLARLKLIPVNNSLPSFFSANRQVLGSVAESILQISK